MENYFFETDTPSSNKKIYILVIYDILFAISDEFIQKLILLDIHIQITSLSII